jgi:hypothetical protein
MSVTGAGNMAVKPGLAAPGGIFELEAAIDGQAIAFA